MGLGDLTDIGNSFLTASGKDRAVPGTFIAKHSSDTSRTFSVGPPAGRAGGSGGHTPLSGLRSLNHDPRGSSRSVLSPCSEEQGTGGPGVPIPAWSLQPFTATRGIIILFLKKKKNHVFI